MDKLKKNPKQVLAIFILIIVAIFVIFFMDQVNELFRSVGATAGTLLLAAVLFYALWKVFKLFFLSNKK